MVFGKALRKSFSEKPSYFNGVYRLIATNGEYET
jgi:hypothetical protein